MSNAMFDPQIFTSLQQKIDEETAVREVLRETIQSLEKQDRSTQAILSRVHSTNILELPNVLEDAQASIQLQVQIITSLSEQASKYPYYKYNGMWSRQIQDSCFTILFWGYLNGYAGVITSTNADTNKTGGTLLSIEQVGDMMHIPVNLKDRDAFHLSIEEYLHALIGLIDELARLCRNSVTLQNYSAPLQIATFIKDLHAGFSILNLKNDALRKRSDGIKYRVKEVEDVVYDLSLRGLIKSS